MARRRRPTTPAPPAPTSALSTEAILLSLVDPVHQYLWDFARAVIDVAGGLVRPGRKHSSGYLAGLAAARQAGNREYERLQHCPLCGAKAGYDAVAEQCHAPDHQHARKWNGKCPAGKHGLDYPGQPCDRCQAQHERRLITAVLRTYRAGYITNSLSAVHQACTVLERLHALHDRTDR